MIILRVQMNRLQVQSAVEWRERGSFVPSRLIDGANIVAAVYCASGAFQHCKLMGKVNFSWLMGRLCDNVRDNAAFKYAFGHFEWALSIESF